MAWRLDKSVVRGEIDNRTPGQVVGRIWLHGRAQPVTLKLKGNCWRDMAGCLVTFVNPNPGPGDHTNLSATQHGSVGDMTASRKVRVLDCSVEESMQLAKAGRKFPEHMGNAVYLEWFSLFNGRVVIESADFKITFSERVWTMTKEQEREQGIANQEAMGQWMERLGKAMAAGKEELTDEDMAEAEKPMDEFAWEKFLKESDARTDKYMELLEKYGDSPEAEKQIAREMGWDRLVDALEEKDHGTTDTPDERGNAFDDLPPLEPNPLTEGVNWIRDEYGHPRHPLQKRMFEVAMEMWHYCDDRGLLADQSDKDLHEMVFQAQTTGAKLAGALNGLAYEEDLREPGLIVASLKRALGYLNKSLAAADKVAEKKWIEAERLESFRKSLFEVREEILSLMKRFRGDR